MAKYSHSPSSRTRLLKTPFFAAAGLVSALLSLGNAGAVLIEFTTGEGYANGTLNGQPTGSPLWATASDTGTPFTVNTAGGGSVAFSTAINNRNIGYNSATDFATVGTSFTTYIEFSFVQSTATTGANTTAAGLLYSDTQTSGSIGGTIAGFGRSAATDGYRMASFSTTSTTIAGSALGINSGTGDTTSDVIRMTLTLTRGSATNNWTATETIYNVTTGIQVATVSTSSVNIGANDPATLFSAMQIGGTMTTSGFSSFTVLAYGSPVPEPTAVTLVGLGCALTVLRRRR